jgi:hypothetical protein
VGEMRAAGQDDDAEMFECLAGFEKFKKGGHTGDNIASWMNDKMAALMLTAADFGLSTPGGASNGLLDMVLCGLEYEKCSIHNLQRAEVYANGTADKTKANKHGPNPGCQTLLRENRVVVSKVRRTPPLTEAIELSQKARGVKGNCVLTVERFSTTAISGGTAKGHAPHCPPKTAESALLHAPLSTHLDEISFRRVPQSEPFFGPFGPPGRPRVPLPPSNCAKIAGAGAFPPLRPPLRRCAAPWLGYAQPKTPKRGDLAASPHMGGGFNCHAANSRIPSFAFYVRLGSPVLQVVALSARLDEISLPLAAQSEPFFGLFGPSGRPRGPLPPSNCAKFAGAGAFPPLRPPPCAATRHPGWATPSPRSPKQSSALQIESNRSPRRNALKISQKVPCPNSLPL